MARRLTSFSVPERLSNTGAFVSLDDQLASVVEQDGVRISTPRGVRKRKRSSGSSVFSVAASEVPAFSEVHAESVSSISSVQDPIAELDQKSAKFMLRPTGGTQRHDVHIRHAEHVQSPYVLSLQTLALKPAGKSPDERIQVTEAARVTSHDAVARPPEIYATVSTDLMYEGENPHALAEQFTPDTFEAAYSAVYGSFGGIQSTLRDVASVVTSWFQRIERVEKDVVDEAEAALTVLEVPRVSYARALAGFAALALIVTLPANAISLYRAVSSQEAVASSAGNAAVNDLALAKDAKTIPSSAEALKRASSRFREADAVLSDASALAVGLASILPQEYRSARALLEVGDKSTDAAHLLALGLDKIFADPSRRLDERLDVLGAYARTALVLLSDASKAAATVDPSAVPASKREQVTRLLAELDQSTQAVREFSALSDFLSVMVGKNNERNYLVIFQNNTELRPTGGFMGSFAEVKMDQGAVKAVRVPPGGTYALKGQLLARVASPRPLQLINPLWQFQDSNWSPDFPTAAQKIRWFWSKAGQPTIDGVIAVNATVVQNILSQTGPIEMPEYGKTITADNFLLETQKAVEIDYDKQANTPKKFIGDLATKLLARLTSLPKEDWLKMASLVSSALETKDIQIAMTDPVEERVVERYGWNGRIKNSAGDSLAIIEANIAGQKTDGMVKEHVEHAVTIADDGSIQTAVTLSRSHLGRKGDLFNGVRNVSYVRFYVPKGTALLAASGFQAPDQKLFKLVDNDVSQDPDVSTTGTQSRVGPDGVDIYDEGDRTVFGGWMQLDPGATQQIVLSYRLPFTISDILARAEAAPQQAADAPRGAYLLLLSSQSGKSDRDLHTTIALPKDWTLAWSHKPNGSGEAGFGYTGAWDRDLVLAAVLTPPHGQISSQKSTTSGN